MLLPLTNLLRKTRAKMQKSYLHGPTLDTFNDVKNAKANFTKLSYFSGEPDIRCISY